MKSAGVCVPSVSLAKNFLYYCRCPPPTDDMFEHATDDMSEHDTDDMSEHATVR